MSVLGRTKICDQKQQFGHILIANQVVSRHTATLMKSERRENEVKKEGRRGKVLEGKKECSSDDRGRRGCKKKGRGFEVWHNKKNHRLKNKGRSEDCLEGSDREGRRDQGRDKSPKLQGLASSWEILPKKDRDFGTLLLTRNRQGTGFSTEHYVHQSFRLQTGMTCY